MNKKLNKRLKLIAIIVAIIISIIALAFGLSKFIFSRETKNTPLNFNEYSVQANEISFSPKDANLGPDDYTGGEVTVTISPSILATVNSGKTGEDLMKIQYQLTALDENASQQEAAWQDYTVPFDVAHNAKVNVRLVTRYTSQTAIDMDYTGPVTSKNITQIAVAKIGTTTYETLAEAITAWTEMTAQEQQNKKIELVADADDSITIPAGENITIDLKGYTLTGQTTTTDDQTGETTTQNATAITVNGTLNLIDSGKTAQGTTTYGSVTSSSNTAIQVSSTGTLTLGTNESATSGNEEVVNTTGPTINGGTASNGITVANGGTLNFYDGKITAPSAANHTAIVINNTPVGEEDVNRLTIPNGYKLILEVDTVSGREVATLTRTITVSFDTNGGTPSTIASIETVEGKAYNTYATWPSDPTREGYTFDGWNGKNLFDEESIFLSINGARYENGYYVFNAQRAAEKYSSGISQLQGFKENTQYVLTIEGYGIPSNNNNVTTAFRLYIKYTDGTSTHGLYQYVFADSTEQKISIRSDSTKTIDFIAMSYGFDGLIYISSVQLEEGNTATPYEPYFVTSSTPVTQTTDHTLTAIWTPTTQPLTYDYGTNGGRISSSNNGTTETEEVLIGSTINLTTTKTTAYKEGWAFLGWNTDPTATTALNSLEMPNTAETLYAIYANMNLSANTAIIDLNGVNPPTQTITLTGSNYGTATVTSSDSTIATATIENNTITITGVATGTATITVTSSATDINANPITKTITVNVIKTPASIAITPATSTIGVNASLNTTNLSATISPTGTTTNNAITWSSSNSTIATVDQNGTVTGLAEGTVTITATTGTNNQVTSTATVNVDNTAPTITITRNTYNQFTYTATDDNQITEIAITTTNTEPTTWTSATGTTVTGTQTPSQEGTYYIWAKDIAGNVGNTSIAAHTLTRTRGSGTDLTIRADGTDSTTGTSLENNTTVVLHGTPVYAAAAASSHYHAILRNGETEILAAGSIVTINENTTITSIAEKDSYNIQYVLNGGTAGANMPTTSQYDAEVIISNPTKEGYNFVGWTGTNISNGAKYGNMYNNWDGTTPVTQEKFIYLNDVHNATVTLTANWEINSYRVNYNYAGGSIGNNTNPTILRYNDGYSINQPTKAGCDFVGWISNDLGPNARCNYSTWTNGTIAEIGTYFQNLAPLPTGDVMQEVTVTAVYKTQYYNIVYDYDGGTDPNNPTEARYGHTFDVTDPSKNGYTFVGWSSTDVGSSAQANYNPWNGTTKWAYRFADLADRVSGEERATVHIKAEWEENDIVEDYNSRGTLNSAGAKRQIKAAYGTLPTPQQLVQINDATYATITEAIQSANSGDTIKILEDLSLTEEVIIENDKNITLNLNGKTITSTSTNTINNQGTLTIQGTGIIKNEVENGVVIYNTGILNIENGVITTAANGGKAIFNIGDGSKSGIADEENVEKSRIMSNGVVNMNGGKVITEGIGAIGIYNVEEGKASIKGGIIETRGYGSKGVYNSSEFEIENAKVIVSEDDSIGIYNAKDSKTCVVKNTEITIEAEEIENYELIKNTDQFKEELEQMKPSYGIYNDSETEVVLESGTIKVERLKGVGIINNFEGSVTLGEEDDELSTSSPIIYAISDNTTAIINSNSDKGEINFYDGKIISIQSIKNIFTGLLKKHYVFEEIGASNVASYLKEIVEETGNENDFNIGDGSESAITDANNVETEDIEEENVEEEPSTAEEK